MIWCMILPRIYSLTNMSNKLVVQEIHEPVAEREFIADFIFGTVGFPFDIFKFIWEDTFYHIYNTGVPDAYN